MPYQIGWMIENHVIYTKVWDTINEDEFRQMLQTATNMVENSPSEYVHLINDSTEIKEMLPIHKQVKVYRGYKPSPRTGWTLMVGLNNTFMQFMTSLASHVMGVNMRTFDTLGEAIDHLQKVAPQLEWDTAVTSHTIE